MNSLNQRWDPVKYDKNASYVAELGMPVVELLSPQPDEKILDLGCGDGALTQLIGAYGCAVHGVDSSPEMVKAAQARGLEAEVLQGQSLAINKKFDAVFSNAALHWMKPPESVIHGVWRALKPGGRFVGEFGGAGNIATIVSAMEESLRARGIEIQCPWFFPQPYEYVDRLKAAGFEVKSMEYFPRPTFLPGNVSGWLETFAEPYTSCLPEEDKPTFINEVAAVLAPKLRDDKGRCVADYVRLRFKAVRPGQS